MNATGFGDDRAAFVGDRSFEQHDVNHTDGQSSDEYSTTVAAYRAISVVVYALGVPGNVLVAIVWLRRHIATENPSAVYLAALAVNDLLWLLADLLAPYVDDCLGSVYWLCQCVQYLVFAGDAYDPLLVLSFSVARLIAIFRPLQVRWSSGRASVFGRCAFAVLRSTCS